jgi:tight adherence protein C
MWSVVAGLGHQAGRGRDESIVLRVASTLVDVSHEARRIISPAASDPVTIFGRLAHPTLVSLSEAVDTVFGGDRSTRSLLARAGVTTAPADYRMQRLVWSGAGLALALFVLGIPAIQSPQSSALPALVGAVLGGVGGAWLSDQRLHRAAKSRHEELLDQCPTMVELLALSLSAGQSLPHALERVTSRSQGALGREWRKVLTQVDLGAPLGSTLRQSAEDMAVPEISALVDHLVFAMERGAPLAEIVRSHSNDARAERLRGIVERSGKAEIAMLVPLVLLILPITVLFAVWPGLQALQLGL